MAFPMNHMVGILEYCMEMTCIPADTVCLYEHNLDLPKINVRIHLYDMCKKTVPPPHIVENIYLHICKVQMKSI